MYNIQNTSKYFLKMTVPPQFREGGYQNSVGKKVEEQGELNKYLEIKLVNLRADLYISFSKSFKTQSDTLIIFFARLTVIFSAILKASQMLGAEPESDQGRGDTVIAMATKLVFEAYENAESRKKVMKLLPSF